MFDCDGAIWFSDLGGADMMDAYLTFSGHGTLVKCRWHEPGMRLVYNR